MRRKLKLAAIAGLLPVLAQASTSTEVGLRDGNPSVTDDGTTLTASGTLVGLSRHKDVFIKLEANATAEARCTNPGGEQPPGQNPVYRQVSMIGYASFPAGHIRRGALTFALTTVAPPAQVTGAPDCPNANWKETIVGVTFTSFKLSVEQPRGTRVSTASCICLEPTSNGAVPSSRVSCALY